MDNKVRIPIRVNASEIPQEEPGGDTPPVVGADSAVANGSDASSARHSAGPYGQTYAKQRRWFQDRPTSRGQTEGGLGQNADLVSAGPAEEPAAPVPEAKTQEEELEVWRDRALRWQAEMENFRKRQQRLADERILADRERLLRSLVGVADDLKRALSTDGANPESLRQGVDLTYRAMVRLLHQEGVEPIPARGQPFDPEQHEAVGTVPHQDAGAEPDTVVEVVQAGYRLGDRLLRPARVIVAT
jgi:molecular chaperone GrpE